MQDEKKSIFTFWNIFNFTIFVYCVLDIVTNGFFGSMKPSYFLDSILIIVNITAALLFLTKRSKKKHQQTEVNN